MALLNFKDNTVRQYMFGLMGDMVKHAGSAIHQSLDSFLVIAIEHL